MTDIQTNEAAIRDAAYFLWLEEGQPAGRDQDFWFRAVDALNVPTPKTKPARKAASPKAKAAAKPKAAPRKKAAAK